MTSGNGNGHKKEPWCDGTAWDLLKVTGKLIEGRTAPTVAVGNTATEEVRQAWNSKDLFRLRHAFLSLVKLTKEG